MAIFSYSYHSNLNFYWIITFNITQIIPIYSKQAFLLVKATNVEWLCRKLKCQTVFHIDMNKMSSFHGSQGEKWNAKILVNKNFGRWKIWLTINLCAKNLGERAAQIFRQPNFWELRYLHYYQYFIRTT